jgi:hypothetical protein
VTLAFGGRVREQEGNREIARTVDADERLSHAPRLNWRDLALELLVRERLQQSFGPPSRVLESDGKVRP